MGMPVVQSGTISVGVHGPALRVEEVLSRYVASGRCGESILLVEDDDAVREITSKVLERRGYTVFCAEAAEEALRLFQQHGGQIDLLVADISMPGMSGQELASRLRERTDGLKTIFISGFDPSVVDRGTLGDDCAYLQKPFTMEMLAHKVREVIDGVSYPTTDGCAARVM